ncbi:related to gluconate 5-dehydrogenase [Phialocephala subalpina]|uniref:Related to gluconate 5-dehydrogenase n=1 Tax=Phialocephala subalpina TaxID=576137 RepID=A0A1L7WHN6_9HELO|nr:related to gluconate 5-dehydrogenase [Phialocephala subalpina]
MSNLDISNLFGVKGMVVVITGGGSGLGLYVAKALDANGAKAVYIIGRREETLKKAAAQGVNGTIIPIVGDVTSKDSLSSIAERIQKEQGFINVLFANSGIIGVDISKTSLPKDRKPTIKEFKDAMRGNVEQKSNIIVTSSIAGFSRAIAAGVSYSASKAGTNHLVKMLATYFGDYKIRVNGIAPGMFPSEMTAEQKPFMDGNDPTKEGGLPKSIAPLERSGVEEDMAGTALYLMSRGGAYLDGCIIVPDGGRLGNFPSTY